MKSFPLFLRCCENLIRKKIFRRNLITKLYHEIDLKIVLASTSARARMWTCVRDDIKIGHNMHKNSMFTAGVIFSDEPNIWRERGNYD